MGHNFKEAAPGAMKRLAQNKRLDVSKFMAVLGPRFVSTHVTFGMKFGAEEAEECLACKSLTLNTLRRNFISYFVVFPKVHKPRMPERGAVKEQSWQ